MSKCEVVAAATKKQCCRPAKILFDTRWYCPQHYGQLSQPEPIDIILPKGSESISLERFGLYCKMKSKRGK